jgi:hypothetical protein
MREGVVLVYLIHQATCIVAQESILWVDHLFVTLGSTLVVGHAR